MEHTQFCQSCSMPLDGPELHGTEKDGSISNDFCKFCYKDGEFTKPGMTLAKMQSSVIDKMDAEKLPVDIIEAAVARLPLLKRWKPKSRKQTKKKAVLSGQITPSEKHPLEEPPAPENIIISEEYLDKILAEDSEESPLYEFPEPGEGP